MLKNVASICAALILVAAAFSSPAHARGGGGAHFSGGGAHFSGGGAHFQGGGPHFGGALVGGARIAGAPFRGARVAGAPFGGRYYGRGAGLGWRGGIYRGGRYAYGYRHRGYWPYWGWGVAAGAFASAWPYDYGYGYDDYGYDGYGYEAPADDSGVAYCMQRFRSYDPASGTYLGNDGHRHPCP
jgi:hypothetical protein